MSSGAIRTAGIDARTCFTIAANWSGYRRREPRLVAAHNSGCAICHSDNTKPDEVDYFLEGTLYWVCEPCAVKQSPLLKALSLDRRELYRIINSLGGASSDVLKPNIEITHSVMEEGDQPF